jgi:hypothetical protein
MLNSPMKCHKKQNGDRFYRVKLAWFWKVMSSGVACEAASHRIQKVSIVRLLELSITRKGYPPRKRLSGVAAL